VEAIYLQAERGRLPELKRVIVASGDRIPMEPPLAQSLSAIYTGLLPAEPVVPIPSLPPEAQLSAEISQLANLAQEHYTKAQEYLQAGDWTGWGEELKKMEEALNQLVELATR